MKTTLPKIQKTIDRKWYIVDAKGQTLGRVATRIAKVIDGKHHALFTHHIDNGDYVIVINAKEVHVTGKKKSDKMYFRHTKGYLGHWSQTPFETMIEKNPEYVIKSAVWGMLPKNKLGRDKLKRLKVFAGAEHAHEAQQPSPLHI